MKSGKGLWLVLGLLVLSVLLLVWMWAREQGLVMSGGSGETALTAEAQRLIGREARLITRSFDLTGDGVPESIYGTPLTGDSTAGLGKFAQLAVVQIVKKKVVPLMSVEPGRIADGRDNVLVDQVTARWGYRAEIVSCPSGRALMELQLLDETGEGASDPLLLSWDAAKGAFVLGQPCAPEAEGDD